MRSFWRIFWLEWTGLVRSRTVALLLAASVAWMLLVPHVFTGATPEGARELIVRYSLGGVAALLAVALTAAATGSIARERAALRLQLTLVRPVRRFSIAVAKIAALASVAALVLAVAASVEALRAGGAARPCRHVYRPVLVSPAEEAARAYDAYRADPKTPEEEKRLPKSALLRLLAQRARENYEPIVTNGVSVWTFPAEAFSERPTFLRLRVTNDWHLRDDVRLAARLGGLAAAVTNMTRTVTEVPFAPSADGVRTDGTLALANVGARSIMLRPRRDVEVLVEADGFRANLVRAALELLALVTALIAFGVFLGSALARPVALFTAFVTIALSEMSPTVLESYSGELTEGRADRIALALTRFAAAATRPVSALTPLEKLAADECVEPREVAGALLADLLLVPGFLSLLATFVLLRKTGDDD